MVGKVSYFMGANTPKGFVSLFDGLYNPFGSRRCYIIKGGPGTGKSSFMKKFAAEAEKRGHKCEYIYCASDPFSLDGVIVPSLGICIADGTSPHVIEPRFPGAVEQLINLGDCWDCAALRKNADSIRTLGVRNSALHSASIRFLKAASMLSADAARMVEPLIDEAKVNSFAVRFAHREFPKKDGVPGREIKRFLSAVTPEGVFTHNDTVRTLCPRIIGIDDEVGLASGMLLERVSSEALCRGYDVVVCRCPLLPDGPPEHLLVPQAGLAILTLKYAHTVNVSPDRVIHASRFTDTVQLLRHKNRLTFIRRAANELTDEAGRLMAEAKAVHDELERYYVDAMDFNKVEIKLRELLEETFPS